MNKNIPAEIELVVADLGSDQLGEAAILEVSDSGVPVRGVVTVDDDASGQGWYSSLDGDALPPRSVTSAPAGISFA